MTSMRPDVPHVIRPAKAGDAAGCAYVHHTSWVETYATLLPAAHWETDERELLLPDGARHVDERLGLAEVRHVR